MRESVQLDLIGEIQFDFESTWFVLMRQGSSAIQIPQRVRGLDVKANVQLPYSEVHWIGGIVERQTWALVMGLIALALGGVWMVGSFGEWGAFSMVCLWSLVLGVLPLVIYWRGRRFVGIATDEAIVVIPVDSHRKHLERILGLLNQMCPAPGTVWELEGTGLEDRSSWRHEAASGKGFDYVRYGRIMGLISTFGAAIWMARREETAALGRVVGAGVVMVATWWMGKAVYGKLGRWWGRRSRG